MHPLICIILLLFAIRHTLFGLFVTVDVNFISRPTVAYPSLEFSVTATPHPVEEGIAADSVFNRYS